MISAFLLLVTAQTGFDIPTEKANAAGGLVRACMMSTAQEAMDQVSLASSDALEIARNRCYSLRKDYRATFGPLVEAHLKREGVKHYGQDVVDVVADAAFEKALEQIDTDVLGALGS